ncbi:hypothetical protein A6301_10065 [Pectobacterium sp. IFB5596]|nr:hypothetical protein [Pectobacterium sp. IFB5596]
MNSHSIAILWLFVVRIYLIPIMCKWRGMEIFYIVIATQLHILINIITAEVKIVIIILFFLRHIMCY